MQDAGSGFTEAPSGQQVYTSKHLSMLRLGASLPEQDVQQVASRLEQIHENLWAILKIEGKALEPLPVYLLDAQDQLDLSALAQATGRRSQQEPRYIHAVYAPGAPSTEIERALVLFLLTEKLGPEAETAALLVDGLTGYLAANRGDLEIDVLNAQLAVMQEEGQTLRLSEVVWGPTPENRSYYQQVATSFVSFLIATYGTERFRVFVEHFKPDAPDLAAAAYDASLAVLEDAWRLTLSEARPPAIGLVRLMGRLALLWRPYWVSGLLVVLLLLMVLAYDLSIPFLFQSIIDDAVLGQNLDVFKILMLIITVGFVVRGLANLARDYIVSRVGARLMSNLRRTLFSHFQSLSMSYFARSEVGDIVARFSTDVAAIEKAMTRGFILTIFRSLAVILSIILLFVIEWRLALLTVLTAPIVPLSSRLLTPHAIKLNFQRKQDEAKVLSLVQENAGSQPIVKAYNLQDKARALFQDRLDQLRQSIARATFLNNTVTSTADAGLILVQLIITAAGGYFAILGFMTVGNLLGFLVLLNAMVIGTNLMFQMIPDLLEATGGLQRVDEVMHEKPGVQDVPNADPLPSFTEEIRYEDVTFSYTGEQVILEEVSFSIPFGRSVALIGPSGSGKSTVLGLLARFYDPQKGAITIDGHDLRQVTLESLRAQTAVVFQDTALFNTTIRENIRLGRTGATDDEIEEAARDAEIHDLIAGLPEGYDTVVGERGGRLSGGQRQRVAIARALVRNPRLLLLDEATSALDPSTEAAINRTLKRLSVGRTVLSVTHRLVSAMEMDHLLVFERGRLVEQGSHETLLEQHGLYDRLWQKQQNGLAVSADGRRARVTPERLRRIPLFQALSEDLLQKMARLFVSETYEAGETIVEKGSAAQRFYLIVRGQVEVLTSDLSGREHRLAILEDGDYFGEIALFENVPRTATVRSMADGVFLTLQREHFLNVIEEVPGMRKTIEQTVARRLKELAAIAAV